METGSGTAAADRTSRRARRRWPLVVVVVLLVAAALVWWLLPRTVNPASGIVGAPVGVGEPLYVGLNDARGDVALLASRARSTAGVQAKLLVCRSGADSERLGVVTDGIGQYCDALLAADFGAQMAAHGAGAHGDYLLLRLVPAVEEPQAHCGITLVYRAGWRLGVYRSDAFQVVVNGEPDDAPNLCD